MKKDISIENVNLSYGLSEENLLNEINLNIEKEKFITAKIGRASCRERV